MGDISEKFPWTVEQAIGRLVAEISLKDKTKIANMAEDKLVELNSSLGIYIRNEFRLWGNDPLLNSCRSLSGVDEMHPNFASLIIIRAFWRKLQETNLLRIVK